MSPSTSTICSNVDSGWKPCTEVFLRQERQVFLKSGMYHTGGPGKQARRRCAAWPEPRWGSLPDGSQLKTRVVARQQGEFQPTINSQVSGEHCMPSHTHPHSLLARYNHRQCLVTAKANVARHHACLNACAAQWQHSGRTVAIPWQSRTRLACNHATPMPSRVQQGSAISHDPITYVGRGIPLTI